MKKSPRNVPKASVEVQTNSKSANNKKSSVANNGLTLKPEQLMSLLSAIQSNGAQIKIGNFLRLISLSFLNSYLI